MVYDSNNMDFKKVRDDLIGTLENFPYVMWGFIIPILLIVVPVSVIDLITRMYNRKKLRIERKKWLKMFAELPYEEIIDAQDQEKELETKMNPNILKLSMHERNWMTYIVMPEDIGVDWDDIGGLENVIQEILNHTITVLKHRKMIAQNSILKASPGILFYGPPGCGKTMLAKGMARQANLSFINVDVSLLFNQFVGETEKYIDGLVQSSILNQSYNENYLALRCFSYSYVTYINFFYLSGTNLYIKTKTISIIFISY